AALVVDKRPLASGIFDVAMSEGLSLGLGCLGRELEDVEGVARIAARSPRDQLDELVRDLQVERLGAAADDDRELLLRERLELVDLAAREQGGVDLEVRVLRRRA